MVAWRDDGNVILLGFETFEERDIAPSGTQEDKFGLVLGRNVLGVLVIVDEVFRDG